MAMILDSLEFSGDMQKEDVHSSSFDVVSDPEKNLQSDSSITRLSEVERASASLVAARAYVKSVLGKFLAEKNLTAASFHMRPDLFLDVYFERILKEIAPRSWKNGVMTLDTLLIEETMIHVLDQFIREANQITEATRNIECPPHIQQNVRNSVANAVIGRSGIAQTIGSIASAVSQYLKDILPKSSEIL